jgi:hypothetical protein
MRMTAKGKDIDVAIDWYKRYDEVNDTSIAYLYVCWNQSWVKGNNQMCTVNSKVT